jgi:hypothetical protein
MQKKTITLSIPTKDDIAPVAKDTASAVIEAGQAVPSLACTIAVGGFDLGVSLIKEAGSGLAALGRKGSNAYKDHKLKKASELVYKAMAESEANTRDGGAQ